MKIMNAEQFYDDNLKDYNLLNLIDPATAKQAMIMMEAYKEHCNQAENLPISGVIKSVCPECKPNNPPYIISKCYCPCCEKEWQTVL